MSFFCNFFIVRYILNYRGEATDTDGKVIKKIKRTCTKKIKKTHSKGIKKLEDAVFNDSSYRKRLLEEVKAIEIEGKPGVGRSLLDRALDRKWNEGWRPSESGKTVFVKNPNNPYTKHK